VVVIGGGGHAKVLIDTLLVSGRSVLGYTAPTRNAPTLLGVPHLGSDEILAAYDQNSIGLVNAIGSTGSTLLRRQIFEALVDQGFRFESIVHPSATLAHDVYIAPGAQVLAGAVLQTGVRIGINSIVNTKASIDHDCYIEAHVHIAPGAVLCGGIRVAEGAHVGAGVTIIQNVRIGAGAVIGAGAAVIEDVPGGVLAVGVPARPTTKQRVCIHGQ